MNWRDKVLSGAAGARGGSIKRAMAPACVAAGLAFGSAASAQIERETPPPSAAVPVPQTAAEANAAAVPGPPVTRLVRSGSPGVADTVVTTYPSNVTPPPAAALNKTYPLCTEELQDNCRNPEEARDDDSARTEPAPERRPRE